MASSNLAIVRGAYEAYTRRDFAAVFAVLHKDITIHQTRELPWGGEYRGHDGARAFFEALAAHTEAAPQAEEFIEAGDAVVAIGRLRGRARGTGQAVDLRIVHVWTLHDGRVVRFDAYIDTPAMRAALAPRRADT